MPNLLQRRAAPAAFLPRFGRDGLPQSRPTPAPTMWQGTIGRLVRWLDDQRERRGSIARLQHLNDWMLRDIGIDRDDIEASVDRCLWELRFQQTLLIGRDIHRGL